MTTEARALELLGQGLDQEIVASACGVTPARISQLMSDPEFANLVSQTRVANLQRVASIDKKYDTIEEALLGKLERSVTFITKPQDIARTLQIVNQAKRKTGTGSNLDQANLSGKTVVAVTLPNVIVNKFITNVQNTVVEVRDDQGQAQSLVTANSGRLSALLEARKATASSQFAVASDEKATLAGLREGSKGTKAVTVEDL